MSNHNILFEDLNIRTVAFRPHEFILLTDAFLSLYFEITKLFGCIREKMAKVRSRFRNYHY